jgi:hypothetical protein
MRRELKDDFNFDHVDTLPSNEVKQAYDKMEFVHGYKGWECEVLFPVYTSNKLNVCTLWSKIVDVEFQYGGAFLSDNSMQSRHVPGIIDLFGSLVTYERGNEKGWMK